MLTTKPQNPKVQGTSMYSGNRRRKLSPLMLIGISVPVLIALIGAVVWGVMPLIGSHAAAAPNMNCTLTVPPNPLSAKGLATPYQLAATDPAMGPCNEANTGQSAFVQADIIDPATGQITSYAPLVIDQGTQPAVVPTAPTLPAHAVVALWYGFNATILTLQNNARTKGHGTRANGHLAMKGGANGNCVNGTAGSPFGQFAYCNAPNFFNVANAAIQAGKLTVPALGTATDGKPCMTTRDFGMTDMDQSDNVQTQYLVTANGQTAQNTAANKAQLANATTIGNPSDNALLTHFLDPALGCTPWTVPDLTNNNNPVSTFGTDELMAAADQQAPIALVPAGDEMVLVNGNQNLQKTNLYRRGADQGPAASLTGNAATDANTTTYCKNLINVGVPRLQLDMTTFQNLPSPDGGAATSTLFAFLANRLNATLGAGGLNCVGLLNIANPITLVANGAGIVTGATIATTTTGTGTGTGTTTNAVTGGFTVNLDTQAGNADVTLNLTIANFANQQFFVNITNQANGNQVLHQIEDTDGAGMNAADTVVNGLQGLQALPTTWVASITDANGKTFATAPVVANGVTGTVTFTGAAATTTGAAATTTTGAAATTTGAAATTTGAAATTTGAAATATTTAAKNKKHHH